MTLHPSFPIAREKFYIIIGNMSIEGVSIRDKILDQIGLQLFEMFLLEVNDQLANILLVEKALWCLSLLMKEDPCPKNIFVSEHLSYL